jgi:UDP-3-O-acyl-N-acetylglucosamine deacetylase
MLALGHFGETRLSTALESDGTRVTKVAQLMSAFAKFAIDNAWIDLTAEEVATDDSTNPFVTIIQSAGIREQNA